MRRISEFNFSNKRAVSEVVGYVMLITITFVLAGMVYSWLKFYVEPGQDVKCNAEVALTIRGYDYDCDSGTLNLSLQNRGLFDVEGYTVRVNNRSTSAEIGVYTMNRTGRALAAGQTHYDFYSAIETYVGSSIGGTLTFVEIQPFQTFENTTIYCDAVAKHLLTCSS